MEEPDDYLKREFRCSEMRFCGKVMTNWRKCIIRENPY